MTDQQFDASTASPPGDPTIGPYPTRETGLSDYVAPIELDGILDSLEEGILLLDEEFTVCAVSEAVQADTGLGKPELLGTPVERILQFETGTDPLEAALPGSPRTVSPVTEGSLIGGDGGTVPVEVTIIPRRTLGGHSGFAVVYRRRDSPGADGGSRDRLDRLGLVNQFNTTFRQVTRSVLEPTCREDIDQTVCTELAKTRPYEFAIVVGTDRRATGEGIVPRAWAGIDEQTLGDLVDLIAADPEIECPVSAAIATGETQVTHGIDSEIEPLECRPALPAEIATVAAVPVRSRDTTYGVLGVFSSRESPFEDFEVRMLEELSDIVGQAYNLVEKNELLTTDTIVELEYELRDAGSLLATASAVEECHLSLESVVPRSEDGERLHYLRVVGGSTERLLEVAREHPDMDSATLLRESGEESWITLSTRGRSFVERLAENNVHVADLEAEGGVISIRIAVSPETDLEPVEDVLESIYADVELVAKRRQDHPAVTRAEFRHEALAMLTDKQRHTLEAAYLAGYFARPREYSAQEIAAQLDISSSTFHQHLRAAMSKLMSTVFEDPAREPGFLE